MSYARIGWRPTCTTWQRSHTGHTCGNLVACGAHASPAAGSNGPLPTMGELMSKIVKSVIGLAGLAVATHGAAQITFYEGEGFRGRAFAASTAIDNFARTGFNDRASSTVDRSRALGSVRACPLRGALRGIAPRELRLAGCDGHGQSHFVGATGRAGGALRKRGAPAARRANLRVSPAPRRAAVRGRTSPRCGRSSARPNTVAGSSVSSSSRNDPAAPNVPGAILGAVIGGVLGHQIGGGRGQDVATAGGAVAGAAIGANAGRGSGQVYSQDVQRCATVPYDARPEYWDVTYNFRGREHRVQMSAPPGPTIAVNARGEPRG